MNQRLWTVLGAVLVIAPLQAQRPTRILATPLPVWTANVAQQNQSEGDQAYFDVKAHQIVVYASKGDNASTASPVRFDIPNGANANISFSLQTSSAQLRYLYSVAPVLHADQDCAKISLLLPGRDSGLAMDTLSSAWRSNLGNGTLLMSPTANGPANSTISDVRIVSWNNTSRGPVSPSSAQLSLRSTYLPGFTEAFVEGQVQKPLTLSALADLNLPTELTRKVQRFLEPAFSGQRHLVLAPVFPEGTDKRVIAANYHYGISSLVRSGSIDTSSAYISEALQNLATYIEGGGSLVLPRSTPTNSLEQEVNIALVLIAKN